MSEVGIKIKVDGSSVPAETAKINQSLQGVGDQAEKYLKSLMTEYQLLGKTASEVAAYTAKQQGLSAEVQRQAKLIGEKIDLYHRQEAAAKLLAQTQDAAERRELAALNAQISARERYMNSLAQQNATTGMTWGQKKLYDAEQMGFNPTQMAQVKQHITEIEAKTAAATAAANRYGTDGAAAMRKIGQASEISAGQTRNAMRMLPMQMTDVVTQLAGGQNPLLILVQQGGQIKDSFGGIGPAIKGIGAALNPLSVVLGATAVAAGALGYAFYSGSQEIQAFNKSLAFTGNYAGVTANQLAEMSRHIGDSIGTQGAAAEALALMASTGKIAGDNMERYGESAVRANKAAGKEVAVTVKEFASLADAPVSASLKLNETYHYLTQSVFEQIAALEKQGKMQEAVALAQNTFADATDKMSKQVVERLGWIEQAWRGVKNAAAEAWDTTKNVGREATPEETRVELQARVQSLLRDQKRGGTALSQQQTNASLALAQQQLAALEETIRLEGRSADLAMQKWLLNYKTKGCRSKKS
jgi:hypothetical protein